MEYIYKLQLPVKFAICERLWGTVPHSKFCESDLQMGPSVLIEQQPSSSFRKLTISATPGRIRSK